MPFHFLWLVVIVFVMVIVVAVLAAVGAGRLTSPPLRSPSGPPPAAPNQATPLDILARRFAAGEISAEAYQKARDLLQGGAG